MEIIKPNSFDPNKTIHHIRFCVGDSTLISDLQNLGIDYNKSLTMPNIIMNIPYQYRDAFILGYFDGDGSASIREKLYPNNRGVLVPSHSVFINIRGTRAFLTGVCNHLNVNPNYVHDKDSIPNLSIQSKKDVIRFFQCYNNLPFYYKRKHDKFLQRINHPSYDKYKQDQTISSS